jgi:hypothetical protein
MQMHAISFEPSDDWAGPYVDQEVLQRTLKIIRMIDKDAEVITRETDPYADQILAGLLPFKIHVDIRGGEVQLPAEVCVTWPPAPIEGITIGTPEYREYFVWAKSEKEALRALSHINQTAQSQKMASFAMAEEL